MGQDAEGKILKVFFENPEKEFTVREISKLVEIPRATVHKKLAEIKKRKYFKDELYFKVRKTNHYIEEFFSSGLIRFIINELNSSLLILYGSFRKGESNKKSDIDLFVETSSKKDLDLRKFEKILEHKIDLFREANINKLNDNLFNNVINRIKLYGSFKIK